MLDQKNSARVTYGEARRRYVRPRRLTLNYSRTRRPDEDFIKIAATVIAVGFAGFERQREGQRERATTTSEQARTIER